MTERLSLSVWNHKSTIGIEDYLHYLTFSLSSLGFKVTLDNIGYGRRSKSDMAVCIEFAEEESVYNRFTEASSTLLVGTEYIGNTGFNQFTHQEESFDNFLGRFQSRWLYRQLNSIRGWLDGYKDLKTTEGSLVVTMGLARLLVKGMSICWSSPHIITRLVWEKAHGCSITQSLYRISLHLRYRNFMQSYKGFKGLIVVSKALRDNYRERLGREVEVIYLPPLIPTDALRERRGRSDHTKVFFSGNETTYRRERLNVIAYCQDIKGIFQSDILSHAIGSMFVCRKKRYGSDMELSHELYIGQTEDWEYASPMRTYRSLREGYIPVSDRIYKDELIDVSILPELDSLEETVRKVDEFNTALKSERVTAGRTISKLCKMKI